MKTLFFIALLLGGYSNSTFAQTKKVTLLVKNDSENKIDTSHNKIIRNYLYEHLKTTSNVIFYNNNYSLSDLAIEEIISKQEGDFTDSSISNLAATNGVDYILIAYYSTSTFEKQISSGGVTKIGYGCRLNLYLQFIDTKNNKIISAFRLFGQAGTSTFSSTDFYKSKDDVVKAALNDAKPVYGGEFKNIDSYLMKTISN